jgi:hypothetical protein
MMKDMTGRGGVMDEFQRYDRRQGIEDIELQEIASAKGHQEVNEN